MYRLLLIKRIIEDIFIFPFVIIGRVFAIIRPLKKEYRVFYFFPFYHTGGAEKVHAQITLATGGNDCIIFFTRKSVDRRFHEEFTRCGSEIKDISKFTDNKWLYFINLVYRGIVTGYINSQKKQPIVFNGQCNFAYKISSWIRKNTPQVELIHSLNSFSYIRIPFLPFITKTVMISKKRIDDHRNLYMRFSIPPGMLEKIIYIPNAIALAGQVSVKTSENLTALYVGRATAEKRVGLITAIAKKLNEKKENIRFEILGDVSETIPTKDYPYITFHGNISDDHLINDIYEKSHVLLLTSDTEGFPMVIMEAMAHGCVILSTAVGDIPYHVKNGENGFLFSSVQNEEGIIKEAVEKINLLNNNRGELNRMSSNNIHYANHNFGIERFNRDYKELFSSLNPDN